jgi:hypothetical protein
MRIEGTRLLAALRPKEFVVALDEHGEEFATRELASMAGSAAAGRARPCIPHRRRRRARRRGAGARGFQIGFVALDPAACVSRACSSWSSCTARKACSTIIPIIAAELYASVATRALSCLGIAAAPRAPGADRCCTCGARANIDETPLCAGDAARLCRARCPAKACAIRAAMQALPVLGADTIVVVDGTMFGKPGDRAQGLAMLASLSGRSHEVLSAVALADARGVAIAVSASTVRFRTLSAEECRDLLG